MHICAMESPADDQNIVASDTNVSRSRYESEARRCLRSDRYIGDAAANATEWDIIVLRDRDLETERYIAMPIDQLDLQTRDWVLIDETQPQMVMYRSDSPLYIAQNHKRTSRDGEYYYAHSLHPNYAAAQLEIEKLRHRDKSIHELEFVTWLHRRWRLFPIFRVDVPAVAVQNNLEALRAWYMTDTTSVVMIQPRLEPQRARIHTTWLNMHTLGQWACADVRKLILRKLTYCDMVMVEAAHGMKGKLYKHEKLLKRYCRDNNHANMLCWLAREQYVQMHQTDPGAELLLEWPVDDMPALIELGYHVWLCPVAIRLCHREWLHAVTQHIPLCAFMTGWNLSDYAIDHGHYDLALDLCIPNDVHKTCHTLAQIGNMSAIECAKKIHAMCGITPATFQSMRVSAWIRKHMAMTEWIDSMIAYIPIA